MLKRLVLALTIAAAVVSLTGCATYWKYRGQDFAETFDLGFTFSKKPQFVFYNSFESILAIGYAGDFEATFVGWGGNRFGVTPSYLDAWGALVYADEKIGWRDYDKNDPNTLYTQNVGIVGMPYGMVTGNSNPHYVPT
jgi:hypothetical protein